MNYQELILDILLTVDNIKEEVDLNKLIVKVYCGKGIKELNKTLKDLGVE